MTQKTTRWLVTLSMVGLAAVPMGVAQTAKPAATPVVKANSTAGQDIMTLSEQHKDLKNFAAAMQAAGLSDTFRGQGPFTVFAPSDAAFAKLPKDAQQQLMDPENREKLLSVLNYHVMPGRVLSQDIRAGDYVSLEGNPLTAVVSQKDMMLNEAKVVTKDIVARNGIVHIIDTVLMPPEPGPAQSNPVSSIND